MTTTTWKDIDKTRTKAKAMKIAPDPFLGLCYLTFEKNPDGKKLLKYMIDVIIMNDTFHGAHNDRSVFMKLGKQELIKSICKAIEVYKHQEEKSK